MDKEPTFDVWKDLPKAPGYILNVRTRAVARVVKSRKNKNGTRYVRVCIKGKQRVVHFR